MEPCFFVTFNIIISHVFPEYSIETLQVVQKLWRISLSILVIFITFTDFLTFPCYKETNYISLYQMMSAFFHFQHTLNRLFKNCMKLYWYWTSSSWNMKGKPIGKNTTLKKPSLFRVKKYCNESGKSLSWQLLFKIL